MQVASLFPPTATTPMRGEDYHIAAVATSARSPKSHSHQRTCPEKRRIEKLTQVLICCRSVLELMIMMPFEHSQPATTTRLHQFRQPLDRRPQPPVKLLLLATSQLAK